MRIKVAISVILLVILVLLSRVYNLSIKSNKYYEEMAKRNIIKKDILLPTRGVIRDRTGNALAVNRLGFSISVAPHLRYKSKKDILEKELRFIAQTTGLEFKKLKKNYYKDDSPYNHQFVKVIPFISYNDLLPYYTKLDLHERIHINPSSKRFYPYNELASHIIGYVGRANLKDYKKNSISKHTGYVGKAGIEKYYNDTLQGTLGFIKQKVTAKNERIEELEKIKPSTKNATLTLDLRLQKYISDLFVGKSGVVIVMNATNGEIYAAGSFPEYDLNTFANGISHKAWNKLIYSPDKPFTNKISSGLYPPGSVVKMGVALSYLQSGLITEQSTVHCSGDIKLGKRKFRCWKHTGHGTVKVRKALRESCDVYFYEGSLKVGINYMSHYLKKLGFGIKTNIDIPHEYSGTVPNKDWKRHKYNQSWYRGETVISSIGQGYFLVTPLQIAKYTALLATGSMPTPHVGQKVNNIPLDFNITTPLNTRDLDNLSIIRQGMYDVCNTPHGTAYKHINSKLTIAGKTGTAQVRGIPQDIKKRIKEEDMEYYHRSHAWLTTYAPYKNPQFVVTVLVEHGGHGGSAAGSIVSKIYDKLLEMNYIKE